MKALFALACIILLPESAFAQDAIVTDTAGPNVRVYDERGNVLSRRPAQDFVGRPVEAFSGGLPLLRVLTPTGPALVPIAAVHTNRPIAPPSRVCMAMTTQPGETTSAATNGMGQTCGDVAHAR